MVSAFEIESTNGSLQSVQQKASSAVSKTEAAEEVLRLAIKSDELGTRVNRQRCSFSCCVNVNAPA
jgi:hypothetical protein